ncbi:putative oxidoreductase [Paenibacillus sp. RC254]|uniref:aldo/keto reductase n=1 Tax=unclassified Paenibacillus TaxID=185978 RepID=UPI0024B9077F|nr:MULTISPECIES: aldo/keto reductase [unclassified Paenibacillus]
MKIIPLQKRNISDSRLVLGCMPFGGEWDRTPYTQEHVVEAERAVEAARFIGITMFDHADIYRAGKAEEIFGRILKGQPGLREQIVIQSKCGICLPEGTLPTRFDFSYAHIMESVDGILKRLGTEYLDILLLHRPDPLVEPEEVAEAFSKLKASGKVRHFGVSNMNVSQIQFLERSLAEPLIANQLEMSLAHLHFIDQTVHVNQQAGTNVHFGEGLMEFCQTQDIQLQAWSPLAQGRFSGSSLDGQPERIRQTAELVQKLAAEKETTREAIVLGWIMKHPARIQPVIGTANPARIKACQDAERQSELMTRDEWYTLYVSARGEKLP